MQTLLQLHATNIELRQLAESWHAEFRLFVTSIRPGSDESVRIYAPGECANDGAAGEFSRWICLTPKKPNIKGVTQLFDFARHNENYVAITLGRECETDIEQSSIECNATDPMAAKLWTRLLQRLRKQLHRGAWVMNPQENIKEYYKGMAYTEGALMRFQEGVTLLVSASGSNLVFLGMSVSHPILNAAKEHRRGN